MRHTERSDQLYVGLLRKEDDVGGRSRVTRDEERVLRGG